MSEQKVVKVLSFRSGDEFMTWAKKHKSLTNFSFRISNKTGILRRESTRDGITVILVPETIAEIFGKTWAKDETGAFKAHKSMGTMYNILQVRGIRPAESDEN